MNLRHRLVIGCLCLAGSLGYFPVPGYAETKPINLVIDAEASASFSGLLQQAELTAEAAVSQTFAQQPEVMDVTVNVTGERYGQIVPILVANITRTGWQNAPNIRSWARNLLTPALLLGFSRPQGGQSFGQVPSFVRNPLEDDPAFRDD